MCKDCYKKERCLEREQFGKCTEYRSIDAIREEGQAVMQSCRASESAATKDKDTQGAGRDEGNQKATERVFLASEVQEAHKDKEEGLDDGWSRYFRHSTVNAVVRGRHTVHHKSACGTGSDAGAETGRAGNHSG